jgi:hypothetical protein
VALTRKREGLAGFDARLTPGCRSAGGELADRPHRQRRDVVRDRAKGSHHLDTVSEVPMTQE